MTIDIQAIKNKYSTAKTYYSHIYESYDLLTRNAAGLQWDDRLRERRTRMGKSCMTINLLTHSINNVVNNALQNPPGITIRPKAGSNPKVASIYDGLIKYILSEPNHVDALSYAYKTAVTGGMGAVYLEVIDKDQDSNPDISIKRIDDPRSVLVEPISKCVDLSDASYVFLLLPMTKDAFKEQFPDFEPSCFESDKKEAAADLVIAEYWYRRPDRRLTRVVLSGQDILSEDETNLLNYPIVFMHGPDTTIDNKKYYTSLIDSSIDMQKLYNYSRSEQADAIANSPKPKWLASAESIEGHEDTWNESNIDNAAILPFNPGSSVPQRISPEPPPVALITQADQTAKDIRVLTGVADAVQDSPPAGLSGKAISLSLSQRNVGTFHFPHMYNQFIRVVAATIIDMVSNFWTYEEMVDLLKEDGSIEQVNVNGMVEDDEGNQIIADLTKGSYHVMVANGPSYQDRRQASVDSLLELAKVAPQVLQVGLPILLKNMDFAGAEQMAELLSPKEQEQAPGALPPQLAQQFDQYKSMIEQLTTKLEETQQQLVSKQTENDMKLQSDMAILQAKNDHEIAMARMKFEQDMALAQLNNQSRNMMNMNDNDTTMATNKQDNAVKILAMQQKEMEAPEPPEPEEPEELPPTIMLYP